MNRSQFINSRTPTVIETCPHCGSENEFKWDVKTMGYKAHCPVCGKQMMLCGECIHADDGLNDNGNGCDWHEDGEGNSVCFRCNKSLAEAIKEGCPKKILKAIKDGYPRKIRGNDGYIATLVDIQPLFGSDYMGIYRYPGGDVCHGLEEIKSHFESL